MATALASVPIVVDPFDSSGNFCDPPIANAIRGHVTTNFIFRLRSPIIWRWDGSPPVVVTNGQDQFPDGSRIDTSNPNDPVVHLRDENSDDAQYRYSVTVTHRTSGLQVRIDPIIQNQ